MSIVTVFFDWDPGDHSVGLPGGWEAGANVIGDPIKLDIVFDVTNKPVPEWPITDLEVIYREEGRDLKSVFGTGSPDMTLGELPLICVAVEAEWAKIQARERLDALMEEVGSIGYGLSDLQEHHANLTTDGEHDKASSIQQEIDALRTEYTEAERKLQEFRRDNQHLLEDSED